VTSPIVWFTGLPASGKSVLAALVRDRLNEARVPAIVLDSDAIRDALGAHAYAPSQRDAFYRTLANLAALVARQDVTALVAATAPRRMHRDFARATGCRVIEVFVDTSLAECEARDPKGLYAEARRATVTTLPGIGVPYEPPVAPDVIAHGGLDGAAAERIAALVR
jgi:adenylylsulfate kinase